MKHQWDFGVINALKEGLDMEVFPSDPIEKIAQTPYLIFELKNVLYGKNLSSRVECIIKIINANYDNTKVFEVLKKINQVITKKLSLYQGALCIGSAKMKINSLETKGDVTILSLIGILQLLAIYDNMESDHDE